MLTIVNDQKKIDSLLNRVKKNILHNNSSVAYNRNIGYQGGYVKAQCHWIPELSMWCVLEKPQDSNRSWYAFGLGDPSKLENLSIACEINVAFNGFDKKVAGFFAKDEQGNHYLCHSGKIGGGAKGVGKESFWNMYRGDTIIKATAPDGSDYQGVLIGAVDSNNLSYLISQFANEVDRIKNTIKGYITLKEKPNLQQFTPEFEGEKAPYHPTDIIASKVNHGIVVNMLAKQLNSLGHEVGNDRRDLFINYNNNPVVVFEVKTDTSTSSCYAAIGQLLFLNALADKKPKYVAVFPGKPNKQTISIFSKLGIKILSYHWKDSLPIFKNIQDAIN